MILIRRVGIVVGTVRQVFDGIVPVQTGPQDAFHIIPIGGIRFVRITKGITIGIVIVIMVELHIIVVVVVVVLLFVIVIRIRSSNTSGERNHIHRGRRGGII